MTGMKITKVLVRTCGVVVCLAAAMSGWDAEAGWRRRCCGTSCCEPVCCEPVRCEPVCCEPVCCETRTVVAARPTCCTTVYDACGRRIEADCGCTVVYQRTVSPAPACCEVVSGDTAPATEVGVPTIAGGDSRSVVVRPAAARIARRR